MKLGAYKYDIEFRSTGEHANADALSRLPLPEGGGERPSETRTCNIRQIEALPVTVQEIRRATQRDPILSKVLSCHLKGWPSRIPDFLRPYYEKVAELSLEEGCLLWGGRVIIPRSLTTTILAELHKEHQGASRMKAFARGHVWWRGMDKDIEAMARSCSKCVAVKQAPPKAPLHPWEWPSRPWQRLHVDYAGPFMNKSFLVVVDAHSKWAEVVEMHQTTTERTIMALRRLFATHGIPEQIVSDNGPQFASSDFAKFAASNGIKHTFSSPYHPASNGEAERFVRTFKEAMKVARSDGLTFAHRLENFLLTYRTTPHTTTGVPPSELLMRRSLRTRWDLLKPSISSRVCTRQNKMKEGHDQHAKMRVFEVGKSVVVRNFRGGEKWVPGVIVQQLGPLTYLIDVSQGRVWKRHVDHMKVYDRKPNEYDDSDSVVDDGMNESLSPPSTPELVPPTSTFCQAEVDDEPSACANTQLPITPASPGCPQIVIPLESNAPREPTPRTPRFASNAPREPAPRTPSLASNAPGELAHESVKPATVRKQYPSRVHQKPDYLTYKSW